MYNVHHDADKTAYIYMISSFVFIIPETNPFQHVTTYKNMNDKLTRNGEMLFYFTSKVRKKMKIRVPNKRFPGIRDQNPRFYS